VYKPYRAFFTRILGVDNLYKGLSTFGVEMSELRMILKNADEYSLILGDELCSGTETQSALSIFVAGLMDLHAAQSSFIFATHFHEIVDYEEIAALERLKMKHMAVFYDRENDCLVYDRTLRDGAGDSMYGLEVCKSLHLPTEFLDKAFSIRLKYFPETAGDLNFKTTRYNTNKVRGLCEMCNTALSTETHHLMMQSKLGRTESVRKMKVRLTPMTLYLKRAVLLHGSCKNQKVIGHVLSLMRKVKRIVFRGS
jgi:DNA mismatch repair protein MutS